MLVTIITMPTTRFKVFALDLLAIFAAILAHSKVNTTHSTRERISGTPPIIKWLMPPVRAVNAIINTLVLCVVFTLLWARIAAKIANKSNAKTLNRVVGVVMIVTSIVILTVNYL